jgi:copper(I)-binding protein
MFLAVTPSTTVGTVMRRLKSIILIGVLAVCVIALAHAEAADGIIVHDAWSRATPPGITIGVAYFVMDNRGPDDRLLKVSSSIAKQPELHISIMEDGVMQMRPLKTVEVAPGATIKFEPGGKHVMLIGLNKPLKAGDTFPLTLTFEKAGSVQTMVHVFGIGQSPDRSR